MAAPIPTTTTTPAPSQEQQQQPQLNDVLTITITQVDANGLTGTMADYPSVDFQVPRILTSSSGLAFQEERGWLINAKGNLKVKVGDVLPCRVLAVRMKIEGVEGREVKAVVGIVQEWIEREALERA